jgi:purine-binding chemotaxis protein CheW
VTTPAVVFPIGEDQYAVVANTVREVVCQPRATRLPTSPAVLLGAFNLRGEVVPMFDVAALLGIGTLDEMPFALVVNTAAGPAGLVVSGLPKVAVLDEPIGPSELRGAVGMYRVDEGIALLVDVDVVLGAHTSAPVAPLQGVIDQ